MMCSVCRRRVSRSDSRCHACGTPLDGERHLDVVLPGGERVALDRRLVIGRSRACEMRLQQPSVSRIHAEIAVEDGRAWLSDMGSSYGTFVDGRRLTEPVALGPGMRIDLGDCRLDVDERVDEAGAGMTVSVPVGISLVVGRVRPDLRDPRRPSRRARQPGHASRRPRLHSGWSLKRMDAAEGEKRWLLKDHRSGDMLALAGPEAELVRLLDGRHDLPELIAEAEARCGQDGLERLARLLAELADHEMLADVPGRAGADRRLGVLERLMTPRTHELKWVPGVIAQVYRRGGWTLFTGPALTLLAAVALAGLVAFVALIAGRGGTPLVVARQVGLGAVVFVLGRFLLVICHELAHGLCAESFGRPVTRAGIKVALIFPYVFVDTTDAWFEPRRRRIAISLAGPLSDLTLGGAFAIACRLSAAGPLRDIFFQLAFGGYVGALFNLNPLLERDGYHVLVDALREPGLRRRAAKRLTDAIAGVDEYETGAGPGQPRRLLGYGIASACWSMVMVAFAVVVSLRYYHRLSGLIPPTLVWTVLAAFYLVLALPLAVTLLRPLWARSTRPT
jgi:putative peptide zinc metalloprotease protein